MCGNERKEYLMEGKYDVIIIGAGIGGLVAGSLLAKSGKKVLIVEKGSQPGGYCTSFKVKDFEFDAFVHSLGSLREGGKLFNIFTTLKILEKLDLVRFDPSDTIITPDHKVSYWANLKYTIEDFSRAFPRESSNIKYFFENIIQREKLIAVSSFRNRTFKDILDTVFSDYKLKAILSLVILGNVGVPAQYINAFTAVKHYSQFMIDGGYYPRNGIQTIPWRLSERFIELGGRLILSKKVNKIHLEKKIAKKIELNDGTLFEGEVIISNCDARQTFFKLVGIEHLEKRVIQKLNDFKPSLSLFIFYLGLKNSKEFLPNGVNSWFMPNYHYARIHEKTLNYDSDEINYIMIRPVYSRNNCMVFANAPYKNEQYWKENKKIFMSRLLGKAAKVAPGLEESIVFKNATDPSALENWTNNYKGAAYGWASLPNQFMDTDFISDSIVRNLYLCGHWSTLAQGVSGVAIAGERIAKIINGRGNEKK